MPVKSGDTIQVGKQVLSLIAGQSERAVSSAFTGRTPPSKRPRSVPQDAAVAGGGPESPTRRHKPVTGAKPSRGTQVGVLTTDEMEKLNRPCPLAGRLEEQLFPQLLQFIHASNRTGELVVEMDDQEAIISFDSGRIVFAMWGSALGLDVIGAVAERGEGAYKFKAMPMIQRPGNISFSTGSIILECCFLYTDLGSGV